MRKAGVVLLVTTLLLVLVSTSVLAGGVIKISADVGGELKEKVKEEGQLVFKGEEDIEMGFSVGGELFLALSDKVEVGAGAEYQTYRKTEYTSIEFNYIPVYVLGRLKITPEFYVTGKVGYNWFDVNEEKPAYVTLKGGLFYGVGGGMVLNEILQLEILYSTHNGGWITELEGYPKQEFDWKYSKIGLSAGVKF